jgi:Transposase DDE domain
MRPYRASKRDCDVCPLKMQCCPKDASRQLLRNVYEEARDVARAIARTEAFEQSCRDRKQTDRNAVRSSQAHFAAGPLRLRGPPGAQFEFMLAAILRSRQLIARPPPAVDVYPA